MWQGAALYCMAVMGVPPSAVVDSYMAAYNAHDIVGVRARFQEDAPIHVWTIGTNEADRLEVGDTVNGIAQVFAAHPGIQIAHSDRVVVGARVAQVERYFGANEEWPASLVIYTIEDGCIASREAYW